MERFHPALKMLGIGAATATSILIIRQACRRRGAQAVVTQLIVFPVKGCRGISLERAKLDEGGIQHDREWMIVRPTDAETASSGPAAADMITSRDMPRIAAIQTFLSADGCLMLTGDNGKAITVRPPKDAKQFRSVVWRSEVVVADQGDDVAAFLTELLDCAANPVRLVRMETASRKLSACHKYRPCTLDYEDEGGVARLSDWTQLSIVSNQSIAWLNHEETVNGGMSNDRFRMNIVVDATQGTFAEDRWGSFSVGAVPCRFLKQCGRCQVPTVNPADGVRDVNLVPLRTLSKKRSGYYPFLPALSDKQSFFGTNFRHLYAPGQEISVGDKIFVSRYR